MKLLRTIALIGVIAVLTGCNPGTDADHTSTDITNNPPTAGRATITTNINTNAAPGTLTGTNAANH
jgi:hypothetical protein